MKEHLAFWRAHKRKGLDSADALPPPPSPYVNILGFREERERWMARSPLQKALGIAIAASCWLTIFGLAYGARLIFQYFTAT